jgi:hypothetical protein
VKIKPPQIGTVLYNNFLDIFPVDIQQVFVEDRANLGRVYFPNIVSIRKSDVGYRIGIYSYLYFNVSYLQYLETYPTR